MARLLPWALLLEAAGAVIPIATFDGAKATTWPWETVNDPVMGGRSTSEFETDVGRKLGIWTGEVKVVPFLGAPGFCNLQAPGLYKTAAFPSLSGAEGLTVRARQVVTAGITHFNVLLMTTGARHGAREGVYMANYTLTGEMGDHFLPWKAFECSWRGQSVDWCPSLTSQLDKVSNIGVGTAYPGIAARFSVELASISGAASRRVPVLGEPVDLATFDGKARHLWHSENDPVMGGRSDSTFSVRDGIADYSGTCRIVPSLQAPGFTIALTESPLLSSFPDVSAHDGMILSARNMEANITKFKFAFCTSRNPLVCQFQSFKANFELPTSPGFSKVFLPWSKFSNKWSAATGEHTAEVPPKAGDLRRVTQLQVWTEGVAGTFHLQLRSVQAGKATGAAPPLVV